MLVTFPFVIWGTLQGLHNLNDDAISWTASDLAARRDLDWFTEHFGSQNAVLVSWPGASLDDPRLAKFAEAVRDVIARDGGETGRFFREVITGSEVYQELTSEPLNFSPRQAIQRLSGMFVDPTVAQAAWWSFCRTKQTGRHGASLARFADWHRRNVASSRPASDGRLPG